MFLAALAGAGGVGLAGCSGSGPGSGGRRRDPGTLTPAPVPAVTATPAPATPEPPGGWISAVSLETGPRAYVFGPTQRGTPDGTVVNLSFAATGTADHPPVLSGRLGNAADTPRTVGLGELPTVGARRASPPEGRPDAAPLWLVPTPDHDLAERTPEPARDADGYWYADVGGPFLPGSERLAAGETVSIAYHLVGVRGGGRATGTYEFRGDGPTASVAVWDADRAAI